MITDSSGTITDPSEPTNNSTSGNNILSDIGNVIGGAAKSVGSFLNNVAQPPEKELGDGEYGAAKLVGQQAGNVGGEAASNEAKDLNNQYNWNQYTNPSSVSASVNNAAANFANSPAAGAQYQFDMNTTPGGNVSSKEGTPK